MPLMNKTAFAALCGVSKQAIQKAIESGKVVLATDQKRINTSKQENADYIEWCKHTKESRELKTVKEKKPKDQNVSSVELDNRKKLADIELKEMNIRLKKIEESRMNGELLPTKLVRQVFEIFSQSFIDEYSNQADSLKMMMQTKFKLNSDQSAEFNGIMTDYINISHDKSLEEAVNKLQEIEEFSKQNKL